MTASSPNHSNAVNSLRRPSSHSWVEVDLEAIRGNVRSLRDLLGARRHLWAVVKANAYGHGAAPVAAAALGAGADGIAVSCLSEAAELRMDAGIAAPLLVLAAGEVRAAAWTVRLDIIQTACSEPVVEMLSQAAQRLDRAARVHLKIDTGMGRLGVRPEEVVAFARRLTALPGIRLEGVFSHLATAESEDDSYAHLQAARFRDAVAALEAAGIPPGMRHLANSAAALRFPDMLLDGVRAGLLIYGIAPEAPDLAPLALRPALTWKTQISFLNHLPAGCGVSYGATHVTDCHTLVGVLPLGYADGYPRRASNRARVLVRGCPCAVIGLVCMDHMMVDVTDVPGVKIGDEVVLIGRQGNAEVTANELAAWAETTVHEVPTAIGRRVRRVYLHEQRAPAPEAVAKGEPR